MRRADQRRLEELIGWVIQQKYGTLLLAALVLIAVGVWIVVGMPGLPSPPSVPTVPRPDEVPADTPPLPAGPGEYVLCFWNVENLFDDQDDNRNQKGDKEYDSWFSSDAAALGQKLHNLAAVLLGMNGGRGPDILCVAEIESLRAGQLLQQAFNRGVTDPKLHYTSVQYESPGGGRNIGTAILTRLPVEGRPTLLATRSRFRILEGRVRAGSSTLVVVASHWSARVSDHTGATRARYADAIHDRFVELYRADPKVDFLVCGDFNDNPDDPSVTKHLHAVGDIDAVRRSRPLPLLFNLMAPLWRDGGASHYYGSKGYLFDQVCVSPGMLDDEGWSAETGSASIIQQMALRNGRPDRFGGESDKRPLSARGASDHFPVTVTLRVR